MMEVTDSWKLPEYETVLDSDFGTSTTLFTNAAGDTTTKIRNCSAVQLPPQGQPSARTNHQG